MKYRSFRKQALADEIVNEFLEMIKSGELKPGDKLPSERELTEQMQVSRTSLREALRALSVMNIIDIRQGQGTFVTTLKPDLLVEHLEFVFSLEDSTFLQLFEVRKIVEVACAELAAIRIRDDEIPVLQALLDLSVKCVADRNKFREADIELHRKIAEIARNPILNRFVRSVEKLSMESRDRTGKIPGVREQAAKDHVSIVNAIINRDPELARKAMFTHLDALENRYRATLEVSDTV
jgi:DNA-binding FadR family transcriptional regulator